MKKTLIAILLISVIGLGIIFFIFQENAPGPDTVFINDAVMNALQMDNTNESVIMLAYQLAQAFENMDAARIRRDRNLQIIMCFLIGAFVGTGIILYLYCEKSILKPFKKLQAFANQVASGNLDMPLEMDKNNIFGAFTESFDLMRDELKKARENERIANQSKKELVAGLSHDIKTPVASIKAVTELMLVMTKNEKERKWLETINIKAEQINSLITNMFHATLEELQALNVKIGKFPSTAIQDIINNADYEELIQPFEIPNCIVCVDLLRLQQVFDNIIGNSYKYARTDIKINSLLDEQYLFIEIYDFGAGISENELPFIFNKFYRGKNTDSKSGYGLGLYISKFLMGQMGGNIHCENHADGFVVRLTLIIAND